MRKSPTACAVCGRASLPGSRWCAQHQTETQRGVHRDHDEVEAMYQTPRWRTFRGWIIRQNPMCQRIQKNGEQCHEPAKIVHHLWSPRQRPDLFIVPSNVVCLCANDHPTDEGTPAWREGVDYVRTEFVLPSF